MAESMSSPSAVLLCPSSRIAINAAIRFLWSMMLLRRTSVGCAVRTGTIRLLDSMASTASGLIPSFFNRAKASSTVAPSSCARPWRSSARLASKENSMNPRTKFSVSSRLSAPRPRSLSPAPSIPRKRSTLVERIYSVWRNSFSPP